MIVWTLPRDLAISHVPGHAHESLKEIRVLVQSDPPTWDPEVSDWVGPGAVISVKLCRCLAERRRRRAKAKQIRSAAKAKVEGTA